MTGAKNITDEGARSVIRAWGFDGIEANTIEQAQQLARLPFIVSHVALMPDAHFGLGATVGSVIATERAIVPAAVGVDIGCGMIASLTNLTSASLPDNLDDLHGAISAAVPSRTHEMPMESRLPAGASAPTWTQIANQPEMVQNSNKLWDTARSQWGTLGGGNHFVEVCLDESDRVWVVLHSGSRGIGNQIAKRHIDGAKKLMKKYFITLEDPELAYLAEHTPEFASYIHDMLWAQDWARTNREQMMHAALMAFEAALNHPNFWATQTINCHHNYTEREHHFGRDVWVTRKGAIRARGPKNDTPADWGIIPGSMATGTYIVSGLGNASSFTSAAHGAGRRMSRKVARNTITEDELRSAMGDRAWNERDAKSLLDEAPAAYKPIDDVMAAQSDLVQIEHTLTQVLNLKGT